MGFDEDTSAVVELGVIGGTGAYDLLRKKIIQGENLGTIETPFGASQPIFLVRGEFGSFFFLSRHGVERRTIAAPFVNYRANIYALKHLGVRRVVSWSAPSRINEHFVIAQYVVVDDVIDETRNRPRTFFDGKAFGLIRQNPVFCPALREVIGRVLDELNCDFAMGGTYVCTEGPRLETPAEVRKFSSFGADLVGRTICPEVFLARELEMCYAAICCVANYAEGTIHRDESAGELFDGFLTADEKEKVDESLARFPGIIEAIARNLSESVPECECHRTMQSRRENGEIGENWRDWLKA